MPNEQHAHEWLAIRDRNDGTTLMYACAECPETTAACRSATCRRPLDTSRSICDICYEYARRVLTDIRDLLNELTIDQREILGLRAIRYDASTTRNTTDDSALPFGMNAAYDLLISGPAGIRTHHGAMDLLESWVDDWSERCGDGADTASTLTYLHDHTLWAAQNHPAWNEYLSEARQARAIIRRLAGHTPQTVGVPCVHCGGRVVHEWTDRGLEDVARCTCCGVTWADRAHLDFANLAHLRTLPDTQPDLLVTLEQARSILPVLKRNTINQTLKRDRDRPTGDQRLPVRGHDLRGAELYRLADFTALTARTLAGSAA